MLKALKLRFYPTKDQENQLNLTFGHSRFIYNKALETSIKAYKEDKTSLSGYDLIKLLPSWKEENLWLKDASSVVYQQKLLDLDKGFKNFFRGLKSKQKVGFPKFKAKFTNDSVRYPKNGFTYKDGEIKLAKHKEPLNIVWSYDRPKDISSITISRNKANQYFVSILTDVDIQQLAPTDKAVGLDLGIKTHVVTSEGIEHNLPSLTKEEKKIIKLQKRKDRKQKGSKNREKARAKLAKAHVDLKNKKDDYLHKLSTQLINENQVIVVEDLNVSGMVKNRKLARAVSKQSWFTFTEMLKYKAQWYGREVIKIDRFFPSSKTCFECKAINQDLKLEDRMWQCSCGALLDRDINAARNILAAGLAVSAYGENVSVARAQPEQPILDEVGSGDREVAGISTL